MANSLMANKYPLGEGDNFWKRPRDPGAYQRLICPHCGRTIWSSGEMREHMQQCDLERRRRTQRELDQKMQDALRKAAERREADETQIEKNTVKDLLDLLDELS